MDDQPDGNCIELLRKGIDEYVPETAGIAPAHRIRGLEFDHVALLHGGWNCARRAVDAGAPRRLYCVAMTRARQTLALTCRREQTRSWMRAGRSRRVAARRAGGSSNHAA